MLILKSLRDAGKFVLRQNRLGSNVRWDGWTLVFHTPNPKAYTSVNGSFYNGEWGFEKRVEVDSDGTWKVDYRDVRRPKRAGN